MKRKQRKKDRLLPAGSGRKERKKMYLVDDKKKALEKLEKALLYTRAEVIGLSLSRDGETVTIEYLGGHIRKVNVCCDSALAMLRDVLKAVE